jgi:hypothetical protein
MPPIGSFQFSVFKPYSLDARWDFGGREAEFYAADIGR